MGTYIQFFEKIETFNDGIQFVEYITNGIFDWMILVLLFLEI